jgi:hypothetical protein
MMLKYFTNALEGNASQSLAINPRHVVNVFESVLTKQNPETEEVTEVIPVTSIYTATGVVYNVTDNYLDVVARFNERD